MSTNTTEPYLYKEKIVKIRSWNPEYNQDNLCNCGHQYYRHFDSWEDNLDVGCKYCDCDTFTEEK